MDENTAPLGYASQSGNPYVEATIALLDYPAASLDAEGRLLFCNAAFRRDICKKFDVSIGDRLDATFSDADLFRFRDFLAQNTSAAFECSVRSVQNIARLAIAPLVLGTDTVGYLCQVRWNDGIRLKYLMEHLDQGVWDYDVATGTFTVSTAWYRIRGLEPGPSVYAPEYDWLEDVHPEDREELQASFESQIRGETTGGSLQYRHRHENGGWVWILSTSKVVSLAHDGATARVVGTDTDITKVKQREEDLKQLERKLQLALDASGIGVWEFDPNFGTVHWDDRMLEMYGLADGCNDRSADVWEIYLHPEDAEAAIAYADKCQREGLNLQSDYRIVRPNGEVRNIRSYASQFPAPGVQPKLVGVNIDLTEDYQRAKELEAARAKLEYDAKHDALTGLGNRRLLDERTATLFQSMPPEQSYAVLHLDLDYFKEVNDTLGHAAGDAVLVHVATIIRDIVGDDGLVCRVGGDEFAVLIEKELEPNDLGRMCDKILAALKSPFFYEETRCRIGVSIGCALGHGPTIDHSQIFKMADAALYSAKEAGRNCYRVYRSPTDDGPHAAPS